MSVSIGAPLGALHVAAGERRKVVVSSFVGTVLEWYDFYIYGTAATLVFDALFFPNLDPSNATLAAFAAYGIGFFLKPVGGVILSRFGDTLGRKKALVASLVMMGIATGCIGLLPRSESGRRSCWCCCGWCRASIPARNSAAPSP